jgi:hypothetical protein
MRGARAPIAALALASGLTLAVCSAWAAPPAPPSPIAASDLVVEAFPVFGTGATIARGWNEVSVRIQNNGGKPLRGQVQASMLQFGHDARDFRATAPFSVGAGASVIVRVPALVAAYGDLVVTVLGQDGLAVSETRFPSFNSVGVTLLDVSETTRLRGAVGDAAVSPLFTPSGSRGSGPTLAVASPRFDAATGDPILPDRAALYASADAVLMRSDLLSRLDVPELAALAGYVLAGGTLAVTVSRPEDLRSPTLVAFAGGPIARQGVFAATLAELVLPMPTGGPGPSAKVIAPAREASGEVLETLAGFAGGNLHGSPYGSSAFYGLGEVHLLAFDPTRKPAVDDPWAQARMVDLARRAFDRRATTVFRQGVEQPSASYARVRQQLDPNESSRWAIAASALLLCLYAVVAGPVNFALAARAGKPLRALRWLPMISAATFALIVGIGVVAKGVNGRARHLTLVEAGAGMTRGAAQRFRGFYASRARELTVRTSDASSVVCTAVLAEYADRKDHLMVDRDGARLVDVAALPWQTVVVREDGFASLGDGVALVRDGASALAVTNRTGHDLRGAVLRAPDGVAYYFPRIKDGERVVTAPAQAMSATVAGKAWETRLASPARAGLLPLHRLVAHALGDVLDADAPGLADAWAAIEEASGEMTDWFPDGLPTLIAQLDGGEGRVGDSGLRLESDRLLVRVVGFGGRP